MKVINAWINNGNGFHQAVDGEVMIRIEDDGCIYDRVFGGDAFMCKSCGAALTHQQLATHSSKHDNCNAKIPVIVHVGTPNQSFPTKEEK